MIMADIHDQAEQWAQANPRDPRAQDIMAKAWASKNPTDPRSAQIMAKFGAAPSLYDKVGEKVTGALTSVLGKDRVDSLRPYADAATAFAGGAAKGATLGNAEPAEAQVRQAMQDHPVASGTGNAVGGMIPAAALAAPVSAVAGGAGLAGRTAAAVGQGGLAGFLSKPSGDDSLSSRTSNAGVGAALGGGVGLASEGVSAVGGKLGDFLMQMAVNRKKYTPGIGTTLAEEGVIGTRRGMQKQVADKLAQRGQQLGEMAKEIPGAPINAAEIGQGIGASASKPLTVPGAAPSSSDLSKLDQIQQFAQDVTGRGAETGEQGLARRIAAGQRSYKGKEDAGQRLLDQLSKKEQIGYSQSLKDAHAAASGTSNFADADKAYGALKRAQSGLDSDLSLPKSVMGLLSTSAAAIPGGALGTSALGQGAAKVGAAAKSFNENELLRQALLDAAMKR